MNILKISKSEVFIFVLIAFLLPISSIAQVSYRATEDALKQLIKDIESVRKAPIKGSFTSKKNTGTLDASVNTYVIKKGDTLNKIISQNLSSSPISYDILKMSIVRGNRHAFKRNNPNWMYAGKTIKFPDANDLKSLLFKNQGKEDRLNSFNSDTWVQFP